MTKSVMTTAKKTALARYYHGARCIPVSSILPKEIFNGDYTTQKGWKKNYPRNTFPSHLTQHCSICTINTKVSIKERIWVVQLRLWTHRNTKSAKKIFFKNKYIIKSKIKIHTYLLVWLTMLLSRE